MRNVEVAIPTRLNTIELGVFGSRIEAVCDEMGATLKRAAFSPNIKDRLDYSCAVFDADGQLCAQAAHIPVHLGSMAYAMAGIVATINWCDGDMIVVNDPYLGGTHLPDVTLISPIFDANKQQLLGFVANRAHHANIGSDSPGSMPISSSLEEEGIIIAPTLIQRQGKTLAAVLSRLSSDDAESHGDFSAQISANSAGVTRLSELVISIGVLRFLSALQQLNDYGERLARAALQDIPDGCYHFSDVMDDDGLGNKDIPIVVAIKVVAGDVSVNFSGTSAQVAGNINCPLSVAAAGVYYVFRCLMPTQTPACAGSFRPISLYAPEGSLLNSRRPAAVAAGNVETSTRVVDVVLGALAQAIPDRIPAASHGSMNNIAMGARASNGNAAWNYYETIGGGMGASVKGAGLSALQTHMTNTLNTPVESLESHFPLRVHRYEIRHGSGGTGAFNGGDGLLREFEFTANSQATLLTERRLHKPWGLKQGLQASSGRNRLNGKTLPPKCSLTLKAGDRLCIETPGGGGWGKKG